MAETDPVVQKLGISERQLAAAMRGVPAQLTDIVVSLQGGQRPLTVLLQQGGQLKDMFGGVVPAARAFSQGLISWRFSEKSSGTEGREGCAFFVGSGHSAGWLAARTWEILSPAL